MWQLRFRSAPLTALPSPPLRRLLFLATAVVLLLTIVVADGELHPIPRLKWGEG